MRLKSSSSMRKFGIAFFVLAAVCVAVAIFDIVVKEQDWLKNMILMWFCAVLWVVCGIIVMRSAKKQKEEESKKVKINAFNYAKVGKKK